MGVLIVILIAAVLLCAAAIIAYLARIEHFMLTYFESLDEKIAYLRSDVQRQFKECENRANPPAHVPDPFKRPNEVYQSTKHIVVPKTPDEIRNQHFEEIKKGAEYGQVE